MGPNTGYLVEYTTLTLDGITLDKDDLAGKIKRVSADGNEPAFEQELFGFISRWLDKKSMIEIRSSGTTATPKLYTFAKDVMIKHARLTGKVLGLKKDDDALLCLPVRYIAGMMMVVRAFVLRLNLIYRSPVSDPFTYLDRKYAFAAMTPMQVWEVLQHADGGRKLENIEKLIIGGGPVSPKLDALLSRLGNSIWHTYGMTETLTHVALRRINGKNASSWFTPLPGVQIRPGENNCLEISTPWNKNEIIITQDIVEFNRKGEFKILGRFDNIINTGGVKVNPERIEQKLSGIIPGAFFVAGWKDERLGEKMIILVEKKVPDTELINEIKNIIHLAFRGAVRPRRIGFVRHFKKTDSGKIRRKETLRYCQAFPSEVEWADL